MVEMADGSFKTALELQIGDIIKTIEIPNENGVSLDSYMSNQFELTYNTLLSSTIYANNTVTNKQKINVLTFINEMTFEDESTWEDTMASSYLVDRNGAVKFIKLFDIVAGDVVLLLNSTDNNVDFVRKIVVSNTQSKRVFSGWSISVDNAMLFLTKTEGSTNNESYVSIEHNSVYCPNYACPCWTQCASCPKNLPYCYAGVCGNAIC
jgi:hypothetical protein